MRLFLSSCLLFLLCSTAQGQVKKILHQSFELETINDVKFDLFGEYEIVQWAGNSILVETSVELYSASRDVYNHFKKEGRYDLKADTTGSMITLQSVDRERRPIKYRGEECFEIIRVRILAPEDFDIVDRQTLARKEPILAEESNE